MRFVDYCIFHFSLQMAFHLIHCFSSAWFLLSLLVVVVVSINRSCFVSVLFSNGFTLFFDSSWFVFIISLLLDIWSNNEFTSWSFPFNSLWRERIWLSKWPINLSEWFSGVFTKLDCNRSILMIVTSFKKDFFRDSNSSVKTDSNFLKNFLPWNDFLYGFVCSFYLIQLGEIDILGFRQYLV